ncbi:hypothetical protein [Planctomyces sp. SH-PL14]|uniref:hypothetical protein n=1 Tax=Planctomyces sp. SH-PL14 TaxID=1632864 RepID=UPI0012E75409|nr:hypothetical protein [Planctomyces sp. SH-PL14]
MPSASPMNEGRDVASNAEIEMRWVDAWEAVHDIVGDRRDVPVLLPDYSVVTVPELLGWLQDSVYLGYAVRVEAGWVGHRQGLIAHRTPPDFDEGRSGPQMNTDAHG